METVVNGANTSWVLVSAALVLLMTPGLAFFYGGMSRSKSVLNMLMMSFTAMGIVSVLWVLVGYAIAFGSSKNGLIGWTPGLIGLDDIVRNVTVDAAENGVVNTFGLPDLTFAGFQMMFAIITVALISGAVADRMKFGSWVVFTALWSLVVYFPVAHWVFAFGVAEEDGEGAGASAGLFAADSGGWIVNRLGALDFAGGTAVHIPGCGQRRSQHRVRWFHPAMAALPWWPAGYEPLRAIGDGGWLAVETATGDEVVLRHVPAPVAADWRETAARLVALRHRRLVAVRAVLVGSEGLVVVAAASGQQLRGGVAPGSVVRDLATALGALHRRGLWHGDVRLATVVADDDGAVRLDAVGVGRLAGSGSPSDDLAQLRALTRELCAGGLPEPLAAALTESDADAIAAAVAGAAPTAVVAAGRRRAPSHPWSRPVVAVALALGVAAGGGWAWGGSGDAPAARLAPASADDVLAADVRAVLARRSRLLAEADADRIDDIYVGGSAAGAREAAAVEALGRRGLRADGLQHTALDVRILDRTDDRATVRLVDELSGYDVVDADGTVVRSEPPRGARSWQVELRRTAQGWRIATFTPASRAPPATPAPAAHAGS